ncbi:hypothetical protein [Paenibacillus sp. OV219]|uniref:hypothetical protein n=1 Tax=Paenibacillus sp. OV219 TaxID=1884377 RepID=UPI0008B83278|nr:hypothetical protein [Paenibacillus sp. OV219]SEN10927.1 hypothetical protein SAMN05518847_102184 [Paenibacillus sp. OV219]
MQTVYSVEMQLPEDKQPGYYAQIVKGIADIVTLIDRDKTMLFVQTSEDGDAFIAFTAKYKVQCECGTWLLLDDPGWRSNPLLFTDYGIVTRSDNHFLDLQLAAVVSLYAPAASAHEGTSELTAALEQASEHALAELPSEDGRWLIAVDRHHIPLMEGIARAYHCRAELIL